VECARHEALLNLAFAVGQAWWLACPYDTGSLPEAVLAEAERNHPWVTHDGERFGSPTYRGLDDVARPFDDPLPEPEGTVREHRFAGESLGRFAGTSPRRRPRTASTRSAPETWC